MILARPMKRLLVPAAAVLALAAPVGTTTVACTAVDDAGNVVTGFSR